ncbi:hypothetical protein B0H65DRAFT_459314, partial [Neurospora tetraspora]
MGVVFDRGLDDSAKNAAAVSRTVFIAFAIECTVPLTPAQLSGLGIHYTRYLPLLFTP